MGARAQEIRIDVNGVGRIHDVVVVAGDWAVVHPGLPSRTGTAACGACEEGCCGEGWAVIHLPSRRALAQPFASPSRAAEFASRADAICPAGVMGAGQVAPEGARQALEALMAEGEAGPFAAAASWLSWLWAPAEREAPRARTRKPIPKPSAFGMNAGGHSFRPAPKHIAMAEGALDATGRRMRAVPRVRCTRCGAVGTMTPERSDFVGYLPTC